MVTTPKLSQHFPFITTVKINQTVNLTFNSARIGGGDFRYGFKNKFPEYLCSDTMNNPCFKPAAVLVLNALPIS